MHRIIVPEFGRVFAEVKIVNLEKLPIPIISFTTPEQKRKERVDEAIELYKKYMVDLGKGYVYGKAESADQEHRTLEGEAYTRREEKALLGEHPATGKRVYGIRRRTRKHEDADKISEDIERYTSTTVS